MTGFTDQHRLTPYAEVAEEMRKVMSATRATSLIVIAAERTHGRCALYGRRCIVPRGPQETAVAVHRHFSAWTITWAGELEPVAEVSGWSCLWARVYRLGK